MAKNLYTASGFQMKASWDVRPTASGFAPGVVRNPPTKTVNIPISLPKGITSGIATVSMTKNVRAPGCTYTATCNGKAIGTQSISINENTKSIGLTFAFRVTAPKTTYQKRPASAACSATLRVGTIKVSLSLAMDNPISGIVVAGPSSPSHKKKRKKVQQGDTTFYYTADENRPDVEEDTEAGRSVITIYEAVKLANIPDDEDWADDWASNGLGILQPSECIVHEQAGGEYELSMVHPIDAAGRWTLLQNDRVIRCGVPMRQDPAAALQYLDDNVTTHDVHKIKKACNVYNKPSGKKRKILQKMKVGKEVTVLKSGSPMYVKTSSGVVGYMTASSTYSTKIRTAEDWTGVDGEQYSACFEQHQIRNQCFRIYRVEVNTEAQQVTVNARHVSYDFATDLIGDLNFSSPTGIRDAIDRMMARLNVQDDREVRTNLNNNDVKVRGDFSLKNPINVLLDPNEGIVAQTQCQFVRDNYAMCLLQNKPIDRGYSISYGKNLLGLTWSYDTSEIVTRIVPTGQTEKGKKLYLPDAEHGCVDSPLIGQYPFIRVKHLEVTDAKVGAQLKDEYGTVIDKKLTVAECYALMRQRAQDEFDKGCDKPVLDVQVDFVMLETTEEYKEFAGLYHVFLYDTVHISHQPTGYSADAQVKGYEWDAILQRYNKLQLGDIFSENHSTVAGYEISTGSISGTRIASSTISGANLQDLAITNAKIDYAAVETAQIADAAIDSAKIKEAAINDAHIGSLNADKITAGTLKTEHLQVTGDAQLGNKGIIETMNEIAAAAATEAKLDTTNVIGYVSNDAITVTDKGLILKSDGAMDIESGGKFAIKSGSEFTVDSANFHLNADGQATMKDAVIDGFVTVNGQNIYTQSSFAMQSVAPQQNSSRLWIKYPDGYTRQNFFGRNEKTISLPTIYTNELTPADKSGCASIKMKGDKFLTFGDQRFFTMFYFDVGANYLDADGVDVGIIIGNSVTTTHFDHLDFSTFVLEQLHLTDEDGDPDGGFTVYMCLVLKPASTRFANMYLRSGIKYAYMESSRVPDGWHQCKTYVLAGGDPYDKPFFDNEGGVDLIWSGSQTIASTFTFDTDITQYKFLILKFGSTYASTITLAVGGVAFGGVYTTSSNTSRMYFLMGTCAWTSNSLKMAWTFRFYKTSATAGGSSTLDPGITEIYGIKG